MQDKKKKYISKEISRLKEIIKVIKSLIEVRDNTINLSVEVDASFQSLYKKIYNHINSNDKNIIYRKIDILDYILFNLIYKREKLIDDGGNRRLIKEYAIIIDKYIDFPRLISDYEKKSLDFFSEGIDRLVVLITHSCQLRCEYCSVRKYNAEMDRETLKKAIKLLFTSKKEYIELQFFGGEPLLKFDLVREGVKVAKKLSESSNKKIKFIITTNGLALTQDKLKYLEENNFTLELSLDGDMKTQIKNRRSVLGSNYFTKLMSNIELLKKSDIEFYSITVTTPNNINDLYKNFKYIWDIGIRNIQINYALGFFWNKEKIKLLFREFDKINKRLIDFGEEFVFINSMKNRREPVVLNSEVTVDCDGDIFLETGICLEEDFKKLKKDFYLGHIDKVNNINEFNVARSKNFKALVDVYSGEKEEFRKIILNNIDVGFMLKAYLSNSKYVKNK